MEALNIFVENPKQKVNDEGLFGTIKSAFQSIGYTVGSFISLRD